MSWFFIKHSPFSAILSIKASGALFLVKYLLLTWNTIDFIFLEYFSNLSTTCCLISFSSFCASNIALASSLVLLWASSSTNFASLLLNLISCIFSLKIFRRSSIALSWLFNWYICTFSCRLWSLSCKSSLLSSAFCSRTILFSKAFCSLSRLRSSICFALSNCLLNWDFCFLSLLISRKFSFFNNSISRFFLIVCCFKILICFLFLFSCQEIILFWKYDFKPKKFISWSLI